MAKQETLTIFPEIEDITRKMSDEQLGKLMRAVMAYRFRGELYTGDDVAIDIAFQFMSSQVDRSETAKAAKSRAAQERWNAKTDAEGMHSDAKSMQTDAEGMHSDAKSMQTDAEGMHSDAPIHSSPVQSNPIHSSPKENKAPEAPAPTKKSRKSFGEFGWVKLTDEEYHRLSNDLGEAEVKRCIAYVDESAQSTGNKNKWRDWNLVIRKCSREGWGLSRYGKPKVPTGSAGASGKLGNAELENIQRLLKED